MNKQPFEQLIKTFTEVPKRLRMSAFIVNTTWANARNCLSSNGKRFINLGSDYGEPGTAPIPQCGTVGCIAGWAVLNAYGMDAPNIDVRMRAQQILDINDVEASHLFYPEHWPLHYKKMYLKAKGQKERVRVVVLILKRILKEGNLEFLFPKPQTT